MQARHVFAALVRALGVYYFSRFVFYLVLAMSHIVPIPVKAELSFSGDMTWTVFNLAAAIGLFVGADVITLIAYGRAPTKENTDPATVFD